MFSTLRERFGIPGIIAVAALVFAMLGGAYAASGGLSGKQKSEVKKIVNAEIRKHPGPAGPQGATGPAGSQGPEGKQGLKGDPGEPGPLLEGLPTGKSLMGVWGAGAGLGYEEETERAMIQISFQFPVSPAPTVFYVREAGTAAGAIKLPQTGSFAFVTAEEAESACPGTAEAPQAAEGDLCIYTAEEEGALSSNTDLALIEAIARASTLGDTWPLRVNEVRGYARGSWAVTAE